MFDNFLPIPDAESLPFYPLVLNLVVCVCVPPTSRGGGLQRPGRGNQRPKNKSSHSQPLKCYSPPKIDVCLFFSPAQRQILFLTAKTADSDLENKNILKLDETLD